MFNPPLGVFNPMPAALGVEESANQAAAILRNAAIEAIDFERTAKAESDDRLNEMCRDDQDPLSRPFYAKVEARRLEKDIASFKAAQSEKLRATIDEKSSKIAEHLRVLGDLSPIHGSPRSLLEAVGSRDPRFGPLLAELRSAGPATLGTRLAVARAENDIVLAAAVCRVVDGIPKGDRIIDTAKVAEEIFGTPWAMRTKAIAKAKAVSEALLIDIEERLYGRKVPATRKLAVGRMLADAEVPAPAPLPSPAAKRQTSVDLIAEGLRNQEGARS